MRGELITTLLDDEVAIWYCRLSSAVYVHFPLAIAVTILLFLQSQCLWILDT